MFEDQTVPLIGNELVPTQSLSSVTTESLSLPCGIEYHLFVSCQEADAGFAKQLIQELETRFQLRCLYGNRDFEPGKRILTNVVESVEKCMKFLLILTPSFLESGFCKTELQQACFHFVRNNMDGCLLCIKLKDCEVPQEIADVTYIDGSSKPMDEIAHRVLEAFNRNETSRLPALSRNGMEVLYRKVKKSNRNPCVGSRYQFGEIISTRNDCNADAIDFFRNATDEINTFWWMRFLGSLFSKRLFCFVPLGTMCVSLLYYFASGVVNRSFGSDNSFGTAIGDAVIGLVGLLIAGLYLIHKATESLDKYLKGLILEQTLCGTKYFVIRKLVVDPDGNLTPRLKYRRLLLLHLSLVQYNTAPCQSFIKEQLVKLCRGHYSEEQIAGISNKFILDAIWTHYNDSLTIPKEGPPRHLTCSGVSCLCQLAESSEKYRKFMTKMQQAIIEC